MLTTAHYIALTFSAHWLLTFVEAGLPGERLCPACAKTTVSDSTSRQPDLNAYCGIRSIHTALALLDRSIPFKELIKPEYVSTRQGSAMADLMQAAADLRLHAYPTRRMNCEALAQITTPVILHVKNWPGATTYNHWVTYAGMSDGRFRLYDGPLEVQMTAAELVGRWGGTGLIVSNAPLNIMLIEGPALAQVVWLCGFAFLMVGAARIVMHRIADQTSLARSGLMQFVLIIATAAITAELTGAWSGRRYLGHGPTVQAIQESHAGDFMPRVDLDTFRQQLSQRETIVVDARWRPDFDLGHVDEAINIEPGSSEADCSRVMLSVPRDALVLVYCQSSACPYSANIATRLSAIGFRNVRIYPGGWVEWKEAADRTMQKA
jgi:rhodanese-related sulfurtransferase